MRRFDKYCCSTWSDRGWPESPQGTSHNSPPFQRRVGVRRRAKSPQGRLRALAVEFRDFRKKLPAWGRNRRSETGFGGRGFGGIVGSGFGLELTLLAAA